MKFLSVRDFRSKSSHIWKELPTEKEMVITNNGRPVAVLASVTESSVEQTLSAFRRARAMEAVASIQYASAQKGTDQTSMDEIDAEIKAVRRDRPDGFFGCAHPLLRRPHSGGV